jgi:phenylalanyl-tRNA synthetase beta subunit
MQDKVALSGLSPNLNDISFEASVEHINRGIGVSVDADEMADLLHRMQLRATSSVDKKTLWLVSIF